MAELDEPAHENKIENSSHNDMFFAVEQSTSHSMSWHMIGTSILLIVNVILPYGIRVFRILLPKK